MAIPTPGGSQFVTDGGIETDLIYHHGVELPEFASFPLVEQEDGRAVLRSYYAQYADIARAAGAGLVLEAPTWRANPDWGARVGYDAPALDRVNRAAIGLMHDVRSGLDDVANVVVAGVLGPRGDGYVAGERPDVAEAASYHRPQLDALVAAGAELAVALTITTAEEGAGIVRAANAAGLPVAISFTVETNGALPDGRPLRTAVEQVDAEGAVAYFGVNCAHPDHVAPGLSDEDWTARIAEFRPNASTLTHAELDEAEELDEGDIPQLRRSFDALRARLPGLAVLGGCCGTDHRHVAALWGV